MSIRAGICLNTKEICRRVKLSAALVFFACLLGQLALAESTTQAVGDDPYAQLPKLDSDFQTLLNDYLGQQGRLKTPSFSNLEQLWLAVEQTPNSIQGCSLIRENLALLIDHFYEKSFPSILDYLYKANDTAAIKKITDAIKTSSDPVAASQNYFLLAQYYYGRNNWKGVIAALKQVNTKDLSIGDTHYFDLLMGFALQQLKEHRKAANFYKHIPASSPYFAHAKLNQGTAYLRQGWWSEAHLELDAAIDSLDTNEDQEFKDRLLVVLAYSQLNYEFYRDARKSLRRVSIDGKYTNKALMGLGLAAAYQEDFTGAINAFSILSKKAPADLSVDESLLLLSYALVETGNKPKAEQSYQMAINHYQTKIQVINQELTRFNQTLSTNLSERIAQLNGRADEIYGNSNLIPTYFLNNYDAILLMQKENNVRKFDKSIVELKRNYEIQLNKLVKTNLELRKTMLTSYLSQAKYGKAILYDK